MKKIYLQILSGLLIVFVGGILFVDNFIYNSPTRTIGEYYQTINDVTQEEIIPKCDSPNATTADKFICDTNFYKKLIASSTLNETILQKGSYFEFPICHNVITELERQACYFEAVGEFKNFVALNESGKIDYSEVIAMCKNFDNNPYYKLLCVRSVALKAVDAKEQNLQEMCIGNTGTRAERIYCVVGFAHKLAEMVDSDRGIEYVRAYTDICKVLPKEEAILCVNIIKTSPNKAYWFGYKDLDV